MEINEPVRELFIAVDNGDLDKVKYLVETKGFSVEPFNVYGLTVSPLTGPIEKGDLNVFKYLVDRGAHNNYPTAINEAVESGNLEMVKYLTEKGVNINIPDALMYVTPIFEAVRHNYLDIVKYLVEHGAVFDSPDRNGTTPLMIALAKGYLDIAKFLIYKGANWRPVFRRNPEFFQELLVAETNKLKREATHNRLVLEKVTPTVTFTDVGEKKLLPKSLLLSQVYRVPYEELCSNIPRETPPLKLIALANLLSLEYNIDISWVNLCGMVKKALYLML